MSPIRILFVEANPLDTTGLRTTQELRDLQGALKVARFGAEFAVIPMLAARGGDLLNALEAHQPHILHIAAHGDGDGLLLNRPGDERSELLTGDDLLRIVRTHQDAATQRLHLVVMPDCFTAPLAELLGDVVDAAVGMTDEVEDVPVQQVITPVFYRRLADGTTVANALAAVDAELRRRGQEAAAEMVRLHPQTGGATKPVGWRKSATELPPAPPLSPAHCEYLHSLFDRWGAVRLADILDELQQPVRLLDVYVPLPIDAHIRMLGGRDGELREWWFDRGGRDLDSAAAERAVERSALAEKPRTWPELGVDDPAQIQPLVGHLWRTAANERRQRSDQAALTLDAEHAAALQPRLVLLGGPGSGKSSFLRHLTLCLAGAVLLRGGQTPKDAAADLSRLPGWLSGAYTPIYVELRDLVGSEHFPALPRVRGSDAPVDLPGIDVFWAYLTDSFKAKGLDGVVLELRQLLRNGKVMVLLDGLDEINRAHDPARMRQIAALVAALQEAGGPDLRILIASRPHAYDGGAAPLPGFGVTRLAELHRERQEQLAHTLLRQLPKAGAAADLMKAVDAAQVDDDMRENPLFFTLWVGLWHVTAAPKHLPATKAGLYRAAVDLLLWRWTRPKMPDPAVIDAIGIDPPALRPVLEALACTTLAQQGEDFPLKELLDLLEEAKSDAASNYPDEMIIDKVDDYLEQHAGILVSPRKRHYRFIHRSFQEHLAACELTHRTRPSGRPLPIPSEHLFPHGLVAALRQDTANWRNVALLAASELAASDRLSDLWMLLEAMGRPYVAEGVRGWPAMALLALEIVNDPELPLPPETCARVLRDAAALALRDVTAFPAPAQRLTAGDALARLGDPRPGVGVKHGLPDISWVKIPTCDAHGKCTFFYHDGTRNVQRESPLDFWIARYPITYSQFQAFVDAEDGYYSVRWWRIPGQLNRGSMKSWLGGQGITNRALEDMVWEDIVAFCLWFTEKLNTHPELLPDCETAKHLDRHWLVRLPTDEEWVKAARGWDDRANPWIGQMQQTNKLDREPDKYFIVPLPHSTVGMYPQCASQFGVEDMTGLVKEYCLDVAQQDIGGQIDFWRRFCTLRDSITRCTPESEFGGTVDTSNHEVDVVGIHDIVGRGFRIVCTTSPSL